MKRPCLTQNAHEKNLSGLMKRIGLDFNYGPRPCILFQYLPNHLELLALFINSRSTLGFWGHNDKTYN